MTHALLPSISRAGIVATLRAPSADAAYAAVDALVAGGITAIEVTYTTPQAGAVIAGLSDRFGDAIILGAGTLTRVEQVEESASSGAQFFVSPGFDDDVFQSIVATGGLAMIGGFTATEIQRLAKLEVDVVKFFPGSLGGPAALRALRGPFPDLTYIPTGGVNAANLGDWMAAGATAVGAGSDLIPASALADGDYGRIETLARAFMHALEVARG
jgi:2-dehydro-3-deoxyphosphogluconate aldolase/(4S)-4-hydroxy-2-oxoglutarate aldolase